MDDRAAKRPMASDSDSLDTALDGAEGRLAMAAAATPAHWRAVQEECRAAVRAQNKMAHSLAAALQGEMQRSARTRELCAGLQRQVRSQLCAVRELRAHIASAGRDAARRQDVPEIGDVLRLLVRIVQAKDASVSVGVEAKVGEEGRAEACRAICKEAAQCGAEVADVRAQLAGLLRDLRRTSGRTAGEVAAFKVALRQTVDFLHAKIPSALRQIAYQGPVRTDRAIAQRLGRLQDAVHAVGETSQSMGRSFRARAWQAAQQRAELAALAQTARQHAGENSRLAREAARLQGEKEALSGKLQRLASLLQEPSAADGAAAQNTARDPPDAGAPEPATIVFTGFRDAPAELVEARRRAEQLGARIHTGSEFAETITHVVAPEGCRSLKVLAAALTGKWIMAPRWIEASAAAGRWLPEAGHGTCFRGGGPFRGKALFLTPSFAREHAHGPFSAANCCVIVEKLGKGIVAADAEGADYVLAADAETVPAGCAAVLRLEDFLCMIPGHEGARPAGKRRREP